MDLANFFNTKYNYVLTTPIKKVNQTESVYYEPEQSIFYNPYDNYFQQLIYTPNLPEESSTVDTVTEEFNNSKEELKQEESITNQPVRSNTSALREKIVNTARQHIGGKYIWGGNGFKDKKGGFDCSGLIYYAYTQNGFDRKKMPRQSSLFEKHGKKVTLDEAQPGDIIHTKGHVKMLSKKVNGQWYVVEAAGRKTGIVERPLKSTNNIISIRNYVDYLQEGGKLLCKSEYIKLIK